jgi:YjbE family integral membrane protein
VELLGSLAQIVLIDLVLSGDNAVVIGMAAHPLPPRQRRLAIVLGGGGAIVLRVTLTTVAALLLGLPALKAVGGVLLLWIAFRLLKKSTEEHEQGRPTVGLWAAVTTILLADLIMSLDNVLGVAAASNGNLGLLVFGLAMSMTILMLGGAAFAELIDRLWWLTYLGALVIAWTGVDIAFTDGLVQPRVEGLPEAVRVLVTAVLSVAVVVAAHVFHRPRQPAERVAAPPPTGPGRPTLSGPGSQVR